MSARRKFVPRKTAGLARKARKEPTAAERHLWSKLKDNQLGARFTRQHAIEYTFVDFICRSAKLIVEIDNGEHAVSDQESARIPMIERFGYRVIKFWDMDVLSNVDGVATAIATEISLSTHRHESLGWVTP